MRLSELFTKVIRRKWNPWELGVLIAIVGYSVFFSAYLGLKYNDYRTGYFDFGQEVQTVWLASQGQFNALALGRPISILAALPFLAYPAPITLLAFQSVVLAMGALPLYLLTKSQLGNHRFAFAISIIYLSYAPLWGVNIYEYHDLAFSITFLLFSAFFYETRSMKGFVPSLLLSLMSNPFVVVIAAAFFVAIAIDVRLAGKERRATSMAFLIGTGLITVAFAIYLQMIPFIPHYQVSSLNNVSYTLFGSTAYVNPAIVFSKPWYSLSFEGMAKLVYLLEVFGPLLFLPLIALRKLLPAMPWLAVVFFDSPEISHAIGPVYILTQWSTFIIPFVFVATVFGAKRLGELDFPFHKWIDQEKAIGLMVLGTIIVAVIAGGLSPISVPQTLSVGDTTVPNDDGNAFFHNVFPTPVRDSQVLDMFVSLIPQNDSVLTQNQLGSKLGTRFPNVWTYYQPGYRDENADAIFVDYNLPGLCTDCLGRALSTGNYYLVYWYDSGQIYLYFRKAA